MTGRRRQTGMFVFCTILAVMGTAQRSSAQTSVGHYRLDIPREPLDAALNAFARQTGLQIARFSDVGRADTLVGPVSGSLTSEQALKTLLAHSGLSYRVLNNGAIAVVEQKDVGDANTIGPPAAKAPAEDANTGGRRRGVLSSMFRQRESRPSKASPEFEEIVVTAARSSLQKSLDIKQQAVGVVDALAALDTGALPDASFGEAVQHIPGVTVTRTAISASSGAELYTGNPSSVTVRGLGGDFTETLIDGRSQASAIGRTFDLATVSTNFVSEVDVLKTPDFSLSSGAIGATVNIKLPKPFDHPGLQAKAFGSETDVTNDGSFRPAFGALFSDTFLDDTVGILIDGDYSDQHIDSHHYDVTGWKGTYLNSCQMANDPQCGNVNKFPSWYPQAFALYNDRTDERRKNARVVAQWHQSDDVIVTLNGNYSDDRILSYRSEYSIPFDKNTFYNVTQDSNGTITSFQHAPSSTTNFDAYVAGSYIKNNTAGINVKWQVNDHLTAQFDADQSASHLNPGGALSNFDVDFFQYDFDTHSTGGLVVGGGNSYLPYPSGYGPNNNAAHVLGMGLLPSQRQYSSDYLNQAKFDVSWHTQSTKVDLGLQFTEDTRNGYEDTEYTRWLSTSLQPESLFTNAGVINTSNFFPGFKNSSQLPAILEFNPYAVTVPIDRSLQSAIGPGVGSISFVQEKSYAPFVMFQRELEAATMPLLLNVGLRYEKTHAATRGMAQLPTYLQPQGDGVYSISYDPTAPLETGTNHYAYILPSLDLNLNVLNDLKMRFDASRTLTRPPLGDITPALTLSPTTSGTLTATAGNPRLLPYLADNFDLGAEWYYGRNEYLAVDTFFKHLTQFPEQTTINTGINNVQDPATGQTAVWAETTFVNAPTANVDGVEVVFQKMLPLGFGVQINGIVVHTNRAYNRHNLGPQFYLPGLANSANLLGCYQNRGFQARLAVNWTAEHLSSTVQEQPSSTFGDEPVFTKAFTEVDLSAEYDITDHVNVFFKALNLSKSEIIEHGRFNNQILNVQDFGRTFTIGVRAKL